MTAVEYQPSIFESPAPLFDVESHEAMTLEQRFELFHERNPWVLTTLAAMTRDLIARGRYRIGISMLFEVMRWNYYRTTDDPTSDWKLNNSFRAAYARLLVETFPEFDGVFETRRSRFDSGSGR